MDHLSKKYNKGQTSDMMIFGKTLYFEAGSTCGIQEVLAIAWLIRNRVEGKKWFGNTYQAVCLKPWQFSCWNGKTLEQIEKIDLNGKFRWAMCLMVAEFVMMAPAKMRPEWMGRSVYYYEPTLCSPKWARKMKRMYPVLKLKHIFFIE